MALIGGSEPVEEINHIEGAELIPKSVLEAGSGLAQLPAGPGAGAVLQDRCAVGGGAGRRQEVPDSDALHCRAASWRGRNKLEPDMVMY